MQTNNGYVYFWNKTSGRIILVLREDQANKYKLEIDTATKLGECKLEVAFNDIIGVNGLRISKCTADIFNYFGNLLASILGIGDEPTGLFNLHGIIVFKRDLPEKLSIDQNLSGLGPLYNIEDLPYLLQCIARLSVLLDAAGYWNTKFIFLDGASSIRTRSGFFIGALLGTKNYLDNIEVAITALVSELSADDIKSLAIHLLQDIAISVPIASSIDILYDTDAGN